MRCAALRRFSTTTVRRNHYDTLSLPRTASKVAIKASFYKLSKKYHPDVNSNDTDAKERFQAVSEAYSILGNERLRRAYDRDLSTGSSSWNGSTSSQSYEAPHRGYYDPASMYENRRRGASHAWEHPHRSRGRGSHPPPYTSYTWGRTNPGRPGTSQQYQQQARPSTRDPFSSPNVRRSTGQRTPFETREDQLKKEPGVVRLAQVLGIVFFIAVLNGGFSASA